MTVVSSPRTWRPDEVRRKDFTVRFRGFDPNEVHGFLNALADDLTRLHEQAKLLTQDNSRLRGELQQAQDGLQQAQDELQQARTELQQVQVDPQEMVTDQAVLLLNQAQQLADALIDEGMQSARDLLVAARHQQRDIIDPGGDVDPGAVVPAAAPANNHVARHDGSLSAEVEDVRTFARVAQVQFKAVLDALNEQVSRLGQVSEVPERSLVGDQEPAPSPATNARRG